MANNPCRRQTRYTGSVEQTAARLRQEAAAFQKEQAARQAQSADPKLEPSEPSETLPTPEVSAAVSEIPMKRYVGTNFARCDNGICCQLRELNQILDCQNRILLKILQTLQALQTLNGEDSCSC